MGSDASQNRKAPCRPQMSKGTSMPIGYLITIVIIGVCTIAALIRARRFGIPVFYLSVVINEIPHLVALLLVLSTVLALSEGDLQGASGIVLLIIAAHARRSTGMAERSRIHPRLEVAALGSRSG